MPFLRLYGYLDGLVPRKVVRCWINSGRTASRTFSPKRPIAVYFASGRVSSRAGGVEAEV